MLSTGRAAGGISATRRELGYVSWSLTLDMDKHPVHIFQMAFITRRVCNVTNNRMNLHTRKLCGLSASFVMPLSVESMSGGETTDSSLLDDRYLPRARRPSTCYL